MRAIRCETRIETKVMQSVRAVSGTKELAETSLRVAMPCAAARRLVLQRRALRSVVAKVAAKPTGLRAMQLPS